MQAESTRRAWASPEDLVEWLQIPGDGLQKLRRMRKAGTGPRWIAVGREVRYAWADVHAWCRAQREAASGG